MRLGNKKAQSQFKLLIEPFSILRWLNCKYKCFYGYSLLTAIVPVRFWNRWQNLCCIPHPANFYKRHFQTDRYCRTIYCGVFTMGCL